MLLHATTYLIWAPRAIRVPRTVVMCSKVHCFAAEGTAVVDERLDLLDVHYIVVCVFLVDVRLLLLTR
jgi:hypothetical protein